ncbi:MAG TPA: ABC transporter ATP-binding protein [Bryobacteraceae bacterium]|nr:ABC transporter ATP-binding protein [Bryobacteraceae bacterium]
MNAVEFDRVSKSYSIYEAPGDRLKEFAAFGRRSFHREFLALRDLSFSIRRGEVFCIIGENGSGKSTTLQIIAGILQPSSGDARVNGRVSALLELGAGFNPEFTGRENVYLNGAILGLSKRELDRRYRLIEEFAEIGDFIDQPVRTYSSGMAMRLAFAVAINVDPEILLVDEALAVGDTFFRHRCMRKVQELRSRGVTIVFVSHSAAEVKAIGERVLWLEHGQAVALGETDAVVAKYLAAMTGESSRPASGPIRAVHSIPNIDQRHGDGRAEIVGIAVMNEFGEALHLMQPRSAVLVRISVTFHAAIGRPDVGFLLRNHLGLDFAEISAAGAGHALAPAKPGETVTVDFQFEIPELYPGAFSFSPWVRDDAVGEVTDWIDNAMTIQMAKGEGPVYGYVQLPCRVELDSALLREPQLA